MLILPDSAGTRAGFSVKLRNFTYLIVKILDFTFKHKWQVFGRFYLTFKIFVKFKKQFNIFLLKT